MILIPILLVAVAFAVYDMKRSRPSIAPDRTGSSKRSVVLALGRVESRKFVRHPAFLVGIGFVILGAYLLGSAGDTPDLTFDVSGIGFLMFPLAGMSIIAVSLSALRSRRDGTEELYSSLPASEDAKLGGYLLTAFLAMAIAAICVGVDLVILYAAGATGTPHIAELLVAPVLVGCAVAVGVTAARLVPSSVVGLIAVFLMGIFQGTVDHFSGPNTTRPSWFAPLVGPPEFIPPGIWPRRPWSHLVYLIGLGLFAAMLGYMLRPNKRRYAFLAGTLAVIAIGGMIQSRPFPASASQNAAEYIERPDMTCSTQNNVEYCSFAGPSKLWLDRWSPSVNGVLRVLPDDVRARPLPIVQRVSPFSIYGLPSSVLQRLEADTPKKEGELWKPDGAIHPNLSWCGGGASCSLALATQVASWAVGLPLDPTIVSQSDPYAELDIEGYDASGQARAAVALWLGARASDPNQALFQKVMSRRSPSHEAHDGIGDPFFVRGCEGITEPGTMYSIPDALLAAQLLHLPEERVTQLVNANWAKLADPRTKSDELIRLFDLRRPTAAEALIGFNLC